MKKAFSIAVVALATMVMVSCSKNSAKDVAHTWLTSFYQMNYEEAKKVSTEDTKAFLSQLQALSGMMPDSSKKEMKKITVTVKDVKEEGDKATATYTTSAEGNKEQSLKMVKKDGKWLVQFSKTDGMGDEGGADDAENSTGADTTGAPPAVPEAPAADTAKQ